MSPTAASATTTTPPRRFVAGDYIELTMHFACNLKCQHCMIEDTID